MDRTVGFARAAILAGDLGDHTVAILAIALLVAGGSMTG